MKAAAKAHAHSLATFGVIVVTAIIMGASIQTSVSASVLPVGLPTEPIDLPDPGQDADHDSYPDGSDIYDGNLMLRLEVHTLESTAQAPYLVVGTQDDQWRHGRGRALEWPHVVDHDPFGNKVGSQEWSKDVLRTGAWWYSLPRDGASKAMSPGNIGPDDVPAGVHWPQVFWIDVRDDRPVLSIEVQLWDAAPDPDRSLGTWTLDYWVLEARWGIGDQGAARNETIRIGSLAGAAGPGLGLRLDAHVGLAVEEQQAIAERHAPIIRFDSEERFFPTSGEALRTFHGFSKLAPENRDYRTWTRDFNNGRDAYVLLLADFDGNGVVDHKDAALMTDVLRSGDVAPDTVYTRVHRSTGDHVVVQFWFIYMYNFVWDESEKDIRFLAHKGDREFMQLTFEDLGSARNGTPLSISYSQHYKGIHIQDPRPGEAPYHLDPQHVAVYPALGSHASYPAPGDDRRFRNAFQGFGDEFDGEGEVWEPGNYTVEVLQGQDWFAGYLWGPATRHSRDLGTAAKPLLQHTFRYPFVDPMPWQERLRVLEVDDLVAVYGVDP